MTSRTGALVRALRPSLVLWASLCSLPAFARDVIPPGGIPEPHGILRVEGTFSIAAGQWKTFQYRRCRADERGQLVPFSCFGLQDGEINEALVVPAGLYLLNFWGSQTEVLVPANQTATVTLKKIRILPSPEATEVTVFRDLTAPVEQMKIRREIVGSPALGDLCKTANACSEWGSDCAKVAQGDFSLEHLLYFSPHGGYATPVPSRHYGRIQIADSFREDHYIVLFDGAYIVRFQSLATGEVQEHFGITAD